MGSETLSNQFIFSDKMDKEALYSLYTDDLPYIEEMFATTLQHFEADFSNIQTAYDSGDAEDLRKAVHKIKPTFGYTGLPAMQERCKAFEEACSTASGTASLVSAFVQLKSELLEARDTIELEYDRLKIFNAQNL